MILPYTIGVVLDDLAQPPTYDSKSHLAFLEVLLLKLKKKEIRPDLKTVITEFPSGFEQIILGSRDQNIIADRDKIEKLVSMMIFQIKQHSFLYIS